MTKRMLIDANHPEETRVVVLDGTRLDEFDVETSTKKQIKGNIYLAKIVRVEPSLQAAFVDYGGNRHGFLAFNEIHPDYYQIPVADRERLIAEQAAQAAAESDEDDDEEEDSLDGAPEGEGTTETDTPPPPPRRPRPRPTRSYKIQDVIKRRQIVLVQVVKEERGNKGAALTTYLSLAGRYCVFMPNTTRGGGVSRKITSATDRKRLKSIMGELTGPKGSAIILRTAGSERSKAEIKRDHDYLLRTWETIRQSTLVSRAPCLIHEEGSLIKRAIRDIYTRDIEEVLVEGDTGYRMAKDFMRMLTPSHAKRVQPYRDDTMPLFHRFQVESQMDAMLSPIAQLKSGGYVVINQTEALVAIDVNSGRSTRERNIEETAYKTNLEAADEIARQLRLRDLSGLIVIDFIDMDDPKYNAAVERRLKEALRTDRARIQIGRISAFGLLEMSRQRLRPSLMETSFQPCPHCRGTGVVRSIESTAIHVLRIIEEEGVRRRSSEVTVTVPTTVALYILNHKRSTLAAIEQRYDFTVLLQGDDTLIVPDHRMDRVKAETPRRDPVGAEPPLVEEEAEPEDESVEEAVEAEDTPEEGSASGEPATGDGEESNSRSKRRRRRRRRRRDGEGESEIDAEGVEEAAVLRDENDEGAPGDDATSNDAASDDESEEDDAEEAVAEDGNASTAPLSSADGSGERRRPRRRRSRRRERPLRDDLPATTLVDPDVAEEVIGTLPAEQDEPEQDEPELRPEAVSHEIAGITDEAEVAEGAEVIPEVGIDSSVTASVVEPLEAEAEAVPGMIAEAAPVASGVGEGPEPGDDEREADQPQTAQDAQDAPPLPAPAAEPMAAEPQSPGAAVVDLPVPVDDTPPAPRRIGWWSRLTS